MTGRMLTSGQAAEGVMDRCLQGRGSMERQEGGSSWGGGGGRGREEGGSEGGEHTGEATVLDLP